MAEKFSNFIRAPGTAGPPTQEGISALGFVLNTDLPGVLGKYVRVDAPQSFTAGEKTQARANIGTVIGSDVQGYSPALSSLAGLTTAADRLPYTTAADTYAVTTITAFARSILGDASASAVRATIGLTNIIPDDNSVTTAKLAPDALSADVNGRSKMADGFVVTDKIADGAMSANASGRAKMADSFLTLLKLDATVYASQSEAEAGAENTKLITSLRVRQSVDASSLGRGQTYQDVTASRAYGTTYTNSTGRPIQVIVGAYNATNTSFGLLNPTVGGTPLPASRSVQNQSSAYVSFVVPAGATYLIINSGTSMTSTVWVELR